MFREVYISTRNICVFAFILWCSKGIGKFSPVLRNEDRNAERIWAVEMYRL
jgi:hypothetical protein